MDRHYDHPILFLQHMIWHEGYHHGQIKLALKLSGRPLRQFLSFYSRYWPCAGSPLPEGRVDLGAAALGYSDSGIASADKDAGPITWRLWTRKESTQA